MAKKHQRKQKLDSKPKTYNIKMPVFTTHMMDYEEGFLNRVTYDEMISYLKGKLANYTLPISSDNRNKTKKTVISKIIPSDVKIGDVPALLLQINAFNTNLYDGYFEGSERIQFTRDNKIGSESNFVLFYPRINGLSPGHYTCYFLMLAYEDATKDSGEVSKLAKIVAKQILNVPVQNIKISMILDELKSIGDIPELRIKYYSLTESDNNVDVKYASYLTKTSLKREEIRNFKNMPFTTMESLISDSSEDGNYQKKEITILGGKKEYKISKQLIAEAGEELSETAEKIFNAITAITQDELEHKIHNRDFIIEKMSSVISNYIAGYE